MKIAFVHNQCLPYRHFLFSALAQKFDIDFFLFNQKVAEVPKECRATILTGYKIPKFSDYWVIPRLHSELRKEKYALIIGGDLGAFNTSVAFNVAVENETPFVPWVLEWKWINHPRRKLRKRFENRIFDYASKIIVPGCNHRNYLLSRGVDEKKLAYIPNCLEEFPKAYDKSHPLAVRLSYLKNKEQQNIVCSIGRHVPFKGHDRIIEAQALLERKSLDSAPFLIVAGDGPLSRKNKKLAKTRNIKKIEFLDHFIGQTEKNILYSMMDVFVLPSKRTRAFEAWGLVCNEALYFEKPIIVSDAVGCANEIVRHGKNGFIYKNDSAESLASHMHTLTMNRQLRESYSKASGEIYNSYRPHVMIDKFVLLINQLLHGSVDIL